jgi:phenylalanyl-tRNA synthetase beta chain
VELNAKYSAQIQLFEIGPVFLAQPDDLPNEDYKLAIAMTGPRSKANWQAADTANVDFYDMKGTVDGLLHGMHVENVRYETAAHPTFHPGKCAKVLSGDVELGVFGEVHPQVHEHFAFGSAPLMAAELDMGLLREVTPERHVVKEISAYPPVLEDFAFVVEEDVPAGAVTEMLTQTAGDALVEIKLFDVFRGEQVGKGKKSLAYKLTYQMPDKTLSDKDVAKIRKKIVKRLEYELGAKLRA